MPRLQKSSNVSSAVSPSGTTIDVPDDVAAAHAVDDLRERRRPLEAVLAGLQRRRAARRGGSRPRRARRARRRPRRRAGGRSPWSACRTERRPSTSAGPRRAARMLELPVEVDARRRARGAPSEQAEAEDAPRRRSPRASAGALEVVLEQDGRGRPVDSSRAAPARQAARGLVGGQRLLVEADGQAGRRANLPAKERIRAANGALDALRRAGDAEDDERDLLLAAERRELLDGRRVALAARASSAASRACPRRRRSPGRSASRRSPRPGSRAWPKSNPEPAAL